jgi:magnesium chelatase family protein
LRRTFRLARATIHPIDRALREGRLTARGADRCLRLAWTLADLAGRTRPDDHLVWAAMSLRDPRAAA